MTETTVVKKPGRARIIERPRLTRLLDESGARIILLIAPAGYGKTTLARQWLSQGNRQVAWYQGTPASADVAALAGGLADAVSTLVANARARISRRLKATQAPEQEVDALAELLAEDLSNWPENGWLCIDDYHFALASSACEQLIETLLSQIPIRVVVTSRQRPPWATVRRRLYGELFEIERELMAMTSPEAQELFSAPAVGLETLLRRTRGWPAVLALAAVTQRLRLPPDRFPTDLYDFFADELLSNVDEMTQRELCNLAIPPVLTPRVLESLFGTRTESIMARAVELGLLMDGPSNSRTVHPLLRDFLQARLLEDDSSRWQPTVEQVGSLLIQEGRWDEGFELCEHFASDRLLGQLMRAGMGDILTHGRLHTLTRWLSLAQARGLHSPVSDLAHAEIALRTGIYSKAESLGQLAASRLRDDPLASRAHFVAGQAAHLANREQQALHCHHLAQETARTRSDLSRALWGEFLCRIELEDRTAVDVLQGFQRQLEPTPDNLARSLIGQMLVALRTGDIPRVLQSCESLLHLTETVSDPVIGSACLNTCAAVFTYSADFARAQIAAAQALAFAEAYRLKFAAAHAHLGKSRVHMWLGQPAETMQSLRRAVRLTGGNPDPYIAVNAEIIRACLSMFEGDFPNAVRILSSEPDDVSSGLRAEYWAVRAVALACEGRTTDALELATRVTRTTQEAEPHLIAKAARLISTMRSSPEIGDRYAWRLLDRGRRTGYLTVFIMAYRVYPQLLGAVSSRRHMRRTLATLLSRCGDSDLAATWGLSEPSSEPPVSVSLSRREQEVYELLAEGLTNREIARTLWISEATVKVHARHIFRKLGVRSRTEAAVLAARRVQEPHHQHKESPQ